MANSLFDKHYAKALADVFNEKMYEDRLSLDDVATLTGTKYNTLFRYMSGSRQMPIDLFKKICEVLNLDFAQTFRKVNQIAVNETINEVDL